MTNQNIISTILFFLLTTANNLSIAAIKPNGNDTTEIILIRKDTIINYSGGTILVFKNKPDTTYLNLKWEDFQFDMGQPGITPYYNFKASAPNGIYKIIINYIGQSNLVFTDTEKIIHFKNGKIVSDNECNGLNGQDRRIIKNKYSHTIEEGNFQCDTLVDGLVHYKDSLNNIHIVLKFQNKIYKGEWDVYSNIPKKKTKTVQLDEDGYFKGGALWTGKKYIYDKNGILIRILEFREGRFIG